ncbi:MAG: TMEM175 family protein [Candidatus Nanopelagicales bacterium]
MASRHTDRGFDRLVNFSDAVMAVAITLLILPLTELAGEVKASESAWTWLGANQEVWTAFLISFIVLSNYWLVHHRMFEAIGDYDNVLAWINFGWLLSIITLPFTTELVTNHGFGQGSGMVYMINLAAIGGFLALIGWWVSAHPSLQAPDFDPNTQRIRKSVVYVAYFLGVGVLSLFAPSIASWVLLGMIPLGYLLSRGDTDD